MTYYAVVGNPHGRGFIEVLVHRLGPGKYDQQPTGVIYKTAREAQAGLVRRNIKP